MRKQFTLILLLTFVSCFSLELKNRNELSTQLSLFEIESSQRYHGKFNLKPELDLKIFNHESWYLDSIFIWDIYYNSYTNDQDRIERNDIKLYRGWLRIATEQSEIRLGRQKLNFGPARLLRSLRWFDKIDPRDTQQNTAGVDGGLFRHFFLNNSSTWLWILISESKLKGNEFIPSHKDALEYGFRIEYPFEYCETGLSLHTRQLDLASDQEIKETRLGFDARWDSFVGYWLELSVGIFDEDLMLPNFEKNLTLGIDYTIDYYNGVYCLLEHAVHSLSQEEFFSSYREAHVTALNLQYPFGFFSGIRAISFYSWDVQEFSGSLIYNYSISDLDLYLSLNFNPLVEVPDYENIYYDGASLQLKAVYNFNLF